jgi:hypothetical protein
MQPINGDGTVGLLVNHNGRQLQFHWTVRKHYPNDALVSLG